MENETHLLIGFYTLEELTCQDKCKKITLGMKHKKCLIYQHSQHWQLCKIMEKEESIPVVCMQSTCFDCSCFNSYQVSAPVGEGGSCTVRSHI